ncbi:MAG: hypothetical protein ACC656_09790, partial [Candidatus Heimdallarchaeota archaeon]
YIIFNFMNFLDNIYDDTGIELDIDFARAYEYELKMWYEELVWPTLIQKIPIAECVNKYYQLTKKRLDIVDQIWEKMYFKYVIQNNDKLILAWLEKE